MNPLNDDVRTESDKATSKCRLISFAHLFILSVPSITG
jgi:hypothetical protein